MSSATFSHPTAANTAYSNLEHSNLENSNLENSVAMDTRPDSGEISPGSNHADCSSDPGFIEDVDSRGMHREATATRSNLLSLTHMAITNVAIDHVAIDQDTDDIFAHIDDDSYRKSMPSSPCVSPDARSHISFESDDGPPPLFSYSHCAPPYGLGGFRVSPPIPERGGSGGCFGIRGTRILAPIPERGGRGGSGVGSKKRSGMLEESLCRMIGDDVTRTMPMDELEGSMDGLAGSMDGLEGSMDGLEGFTLSRINGMGMCHICAYSCEGCVGIKDSDTAIDWGVPGYIYIRIHAYIYLKSISISIYIYIYIL